MTFSLKNLKFNSILFKFKINKHTNLLRHNIITAQMIIQPTPIDIPRTIPRNGSGGSASNAANK